MSSWKRGTIRSKLSEKDIEYLKANTGYDRGQIQAWFREFKQTCPDYLLDKEAFTKFYSKLIPGDSSEEKHFCGLVFKVFDKDNNGKVDFGKLEFKSFDL